MSTPSPTSQRPLSASAVRRILDSLEDLTQGNAKMARAICDLLDDDGKTTIDAVLATITSSDKGEYLRKFKARFNREAGGALTVVFDRRRGSEFYFTGSDPITEDIAEYSEQQTRRFDTSEEIIDARAKDNLLRIYISLVPEDGEPASRCANLLECTIKAGLRNRYRAKFFRTDRVPVGEVTDQFLNENIDKSDLAIALISYNYLNEQNEAQRVYAAHSHPILVQLQEIIPGVSIEPFDCHDIVSGSSFDGAQNSGRHSEQDFANRVLNIITRALTTDSEHTPRTCELRFDEMAEELSNHGRLDLTAEAVPARAVVGTFEALQGDDAPSLVSRAADTPHAVERLVSWARGLDDERSSLCALLGNLGTGKTTSAVLLTRRLLELRKTGEQVPLPIYFDLRDLSPTTLKDFGLPTLLTQLLANSSLSTITVDNVLATVQDELTLVIFDGLDEVLVHLSPGDGQRLTRSLLEVLNLGKQNSQEEDPRTRLLLSCRTQFFRSIEEEFSFFDGQGRENKRGRDYLVLTLLPFDEDQIREYLRRNIPEANTDRLLETIRSVHNLRELASQPVLLNMIRQVLLTIDEDLSFDQQVRSVDLYERFADKWLRRDDGKHSLIPEHKIQLMTHLAWQVWRSGSRTWSAQWMEKWMLQFLHTHPDMELHYQGRMPDQWKQDFRTATFLARRGDDFSFAHSSLLEYFLAKRLADSLEAESEDEALAAWDITRPSDECFAFFAELIDRLSAPTQRQALARLEHVGTHASASARANVFAYTLRALDKGAPHPRPNTLNLSGADLRGWTIGSKETHLNLSGVSLRGARLDDARIRHARLAHIDAVGASMRRTLLEHCTLTHANLEEADLAGTVFRHCDMEGVPLDKATRYRTQLLYSTGYRQELSNVLTAPLTEHDRLRVLPEAQILGGHSEYVTSATWSPDATHILTGSQDGTARIWDTTTGDNTLTVTTNSGIEAVAWSPDATHILTGSQDGTARIWDTTTGDNTLTLTNAHTVTAVAWSPDGTHILTGTRDGAACIWDATTGNNTLTLTLIPTSTIEAMACSPDSTHIFTASADGTAHVWDATTGNNTLTLALIHDAETKEVAWSPNGTHILTASANGTAHVWDATTGNNTLTFTLTTNSVIDAMAWSPDGTHFLTGTRDGAAQVWDATTGENTLTLTHNTWVRAVAWSPTGRHILTGTRDGTAHVWDATTGNNTLTFTLTTNSVIDAMAWSPDGTHFLTGTRDGAAQVWDATTGENTLTLTHNTWVRAVAWSPTGRHILTGSVDGTARIWDATTGNNTLTLTHNAWLTTAAWSPNGHYILSASEDGAAHIWDATTGDNTLTLTTNSVIEAVAWSPDSKHILTGTQDGTTRIWGSTTGEQERFMITTLPEGECAVLSADRTEVIGASPYAWRWLGRYAKQPGGALERIPVEIDGPLPPLSHGTATE